MVKRCPVAAFPHSPFIILHCRCASDSVGRRGNIWTRGVRLAILPVWALDQGKETPVHRPLPGHGLDEHGCGPVSGVGFIRCTEGLQQACCRSRCKSATVDVHRACRPAERIGRAWHVQPRVFTTPRRLSALGCCFARIRGVAGPAIMGRKGEAAVHVTRRLYRNLIGVYRQLVTWRECTAGVLRARTTRACSFLRGHYEHRASIACRDSTDRDCPPITQRRTRALARRGE